MNRKDFIYTLAASLVLGLGSCTSEDFWDTFDRTVDGPVEFTTGVEVISAQRGLTRAPETSYVAMEKNTELRLKVDGDWVKKTPNQVSQITVCRADETTTSVNTLSFDDDKKIYWDDYGTGDPDNSENKSKGLTVLAVAVDGNTSSPQVKDWEKLDWKTVDSEGQAEVIKANEKSFLAADIMVSNNLTAYKFSERNVDAAKKLIFTHPLSKITFNINAGDGFSKEGNVGGTTKKFESDPVLILSNATKLEEVKNPENNYCLIDGKVNIATGVATSSTKGKVIAATTCDTSDKVTVTKQAIVYPDTQLGANDDDVIGVLQADKNIYYIKAQAIHEAIKAFDEKYNVTHTDNKTKSGYNYIINVTVNKSCLILSASITDWVSVSSGEVLPEINVNAVVGADGDSKLSGISQLAFYRSLSIASGYENVAQPKVNADGTLNWDDTNKLYWAHHYQHYHFRGIYPLTTTVLKADGTDVQYVEVKNGAYDDASSPSNLIIGMPELAKGTMCENPDHKDNQVDMSVGGICARKGSINMNFRYMMSQVEVKLTSKTDDNNSSKLVDLKYVKVELVNVGTGGNILLSDRSAVVPDESDNKLYALHMVNGDKKHYHDIIIPQTLIDNDKNKVKFKITVYSEDPALNASVAKDVYYADVAPIKVAANGGTAKATNVWEAGVHYVYNLNITKTQINATATLTDWTTVAASEEVWF